MAVHNVRSTVLLKAALVGFSVSWLVLSLDARLGRAHFW